MYQKINIIGKKTPNRNKESIILLLKLQFLAEIDLIITNSIEMQVKSH